MVLHKVTEVLRPELHKLYKWNAAPLTNTILTENIRYFYNPIQLIMKQLLLLALLFTGLCNAQEYRNATRVTAYRLVNFDDAGPCSIQYYAKKLRRTGYYIQAMESNNDTLAYSLLKLKAEAQNWNRETCNCGEARDTTGVPLVTNMFIVEVNTHKDTVFTTTGQKGIFLPKDQLHYIAPDNRIAAVFTKDVTTFFQRDFKREINDWKLDTISTKDITLKKKSFYGLNRKEFEKTIAFFDVVSTDSIFLGPGKLLQTKRTYYIDDAKFSFDDKNKRVNGVLIENTYTSNGLSRIMTVTVDGVKIGDPEEALCNKYDNSTLLKNWDAPLSAINNYYTYEVYIKDQGLVRYVIRNKIIQAIQITFSYPDVPAKKKKK